MGDINTPLSNNFRQVKSIGQIQKEASFPVHTRQEVSGVVKD